MKLVRAGTIVVGLLLAASQLQARSTAGFSQSALVDANTAFALQFYGKLATNSGNLFFSPYSASSALAMTWAGARGQTASQIAQALHFPQAATNVHQVFGQLNHALLSTQSTAGLQLGIANALWPQKHYVLRVLYLNQVLTNYDATITPLDYTGQIEAARRTINKWADERTAHRIPEFIGKGVLTRSNKLFLANAVYFKGAWDKPFSESATSIERFYAGAAGANTCPLMHQTSRFGYFENRRLQALVLPYAGGHFEMLVLLPRKQDGLKQLEALLTPSNLASWLAEAKPQEVEVTLPKFKLDTALDLIAPLQALRIKDAFDENLANFSGIDGATHNLFISAAFQKAFLDVSEKTTEAAAATGIAFQTTRIAMSDPQRRIFRADHPFVFLIRDRSTGTVLFLGRLVTLPQA